MSPGSHVHVARPASVRLARLLTCAAIAALAWPGVAPAGAGEAPGAPLRERATLEETGPVAVPTSLNVLVSLPTEEKECDYLGKVQAVTNDPTAVVKIAYDLSGPGRLGEVIPEGCQIASSTHFDCSVPSDTEVLFTVRDSKAGVHSHTFQASADGLQSTGTPPP